MTTHATNQTKNPILTLIKYDLQFVYKQLGFFYIIIIALAIIARLTDVETTSFWLRFIHEFANGATFGFSLGMIINGSMRFWAKYRYSIYGDESYLIHTLPLKPTTIWAAKFLSGIIILLLSGLLFLVCCVIVLPISDYIAAYGTGHDISFWTLVTVFCVSVFCQFVFVLQSGITGITLGHIQNSGQMVRSVVYGIAIYLFGGTILFGVTMLLSLFDESLRAMMFDGTFNDTGDLCKVFFIIDTLYLAFVAATYFVNRHVLKRGVNVD